MMSIIFVASPWEIFPPLLAFMPLLLKDFVIPSRSIEPTEPGQVLVVYWRFSGRIDIHFSTGGIATPVLTHHEFLDVTYKSFQLSWMGDRSLRCRDHIRADLQVTFYVTIEKDRAQIKKVLKSLGAKGAADPDVLADHLEPQLFEAIKTVSKELDYEEFLHNRVLVRDRCCELIRPTMEGYVLEDIRIDYLKKTPRHYYDQDDALDARGLKKIAEEEARRQKEEARKQAELDEYNREMDRMLRELEEEQKREMEAVKRELGIRIAEDAGESAADED